MKVGDLVRVKSAEPHSLSMKVGDLVQVKSAEPHHNSVDATYIYGVGIYLGTSVTRFDYDDPTWIKHHRIFQDAVIVRYDVSRWNIEVING
tara:strand:- start:35 stop:307 length:273 start_codon:yes stop_codon:yes gene_type:complete